MILSNGEVLLRYPMANPIITAGWYYKDRSFHGAVDFRAIIGTPVYAVADGIVNWVQNWDGHSKSGNQSYGNLIRLSHEKYHELRLESYYGHLSKICVKYGDWVSEGTLIGYSGASGNCYGAHLHFEVRLNGKRVNPLNWFDSNFDVADPQVKLGNYKSVVVPVNDLYVIAIAPVSKGDMESILELANSLNLNYAVDFYKGG